jgi:hypothetical protein
MGAREATKTITKKPAPEEPAREVLGQRKRPEKGQFLLQVDSKSRHRMEKGHPIVQVAVYDTVGGVNKIIELLKS